MGLPFETYEGLALGGFNSKPYREAAAEGPHAVDFVVRVAGDLLIAPDHEQLFVTSNDVARVLQQALFRLGEKKGAKKKLLEELVEAAYAQEPELDALTGELKREIGKHKAATVCDGQVKRVLTFSRLKR
jgi:hypothetical protein